MVTVKMSCKIYKAKRNLCQYIVALVPCQYIVALVPCVKALSVLFPHHFDKGSNCVKVIQAPH